MQTMNVKEMRKVWVEEIKPMLPELRKIREGFEVVVSKKGTEYLLGLGGTFHEIWLRHEEIEKIKKIGWTWSETEKTFVLPRLRK